MSKVTDNYEALAAAVGLRYDGANNTIYGQKDGYDLIVYAADSRYPYILPPRAPPVRLLPSRRKRSSQRA